MSAAPTCVNWRADGGALPGDHSPVTTQRSAIRLVVFDWAGTTIDFGSFAPVAPLVQVFGLRGVEVTPAEARGQMGMHKKDHLRALLQT